MSLVAEVHLSAPGLVLAPTIRAVPEATFSILYQGGEADLFVAATGGDPDAVEAAMAADPTVTDPRLTDATGDRRVYRVEVRTDRPLLSAVLSEAGIRVLESRSEDGGWLLALELPDREALTAVRAFSEDEDVAFTLRRLYRPGEAGGTGEYGLTDDQRTTLLAALEEGYFEVPRRVGQAELADLLGVSESAVSQRVRRAVGTLVENTVAADEQVE